MNGINLAFTIVTALAVLLQAFVLLGMLIALKGALGRLDQVTKMAEEHIVPTMGTARKLLEEMSPKIRTAVENAVTASEHLKELSRTAREKSADVSAAVDDVLEKTEAQAERMDEIVTGALDAVSHATAVLQRATNSPMRQIMGLVNGLRAGFDVLCNRNQQAHAAADGDHFV
jgi:methyl-accepting chemotaxis protein